MWVSCFLFLFWEGGKHSLCSSDNAPIGIECVKLISVNFNFWMYFYWPTSLPGSTPWNQTTPLSCQICLAWWQKTAGSWLRNECLRGPEAKLTPLSSCAACFLNNTIHRHCWFLLRCAPQFKSWLDRYVGMTTHHCLHERRLSWVDALVCSDWLGRTVPPSLRVILGGHVRVKMETTCNELTFLSDIRQSWQCGHGGNRQTVGG